MVAGVVAAAVSWHDVHPTPQLVGGDLPVNPTALDRTNFTANNSPTVVANPRNPANLAEVNRIDAPEFTCALNTSFDGGASWAPARFPTPPGDRASCLAPDASFGSDGTLYVSFTDYAFLPVTGVNPAGAYVSRSVDGGRTLSTPVPAEGPFAFGVRIAADRMVPGRVHLTWVQSTAATGLGFAGNDNPLMTARSDDGGSTWHAPVRASGQNRRRVLAPTPVLAGRDEMFIAYLDLLDDRLDYNGAHKGIGGEPYRGDWSLIVAHSVDAGSSWHETVVDAHITPTRRFVNLFAPTPSIAVDGASGSVHVAFEDGRLGDADVYMWSSTSSGAAWGDATRVNDTAPRDGTSQYLAAITSAPNGRLDVVYYDRRRDRSDEYNEVSLQSSFDQGRTFTPRLILSEAPFDSNVGFGLERMLPELGTRLAVLGTDTRTLTLWCDTRAGLRGTRKQDIAEAVAAYPDPFPARLPLRYGGFALGGMGIAALAWALTAGRRRRGTTAADAQ